MSQPTILLTGSEGNVGRKVLTELGGQFNWSRLDSKGGPGVTQMDLSVYNPFLVEVIRGVSAIVHLAAEQDATKPYPELIGPNLDAVVNLFNAATAAKKPGLRIVVASSNHVMGGYLNSGLGPGELTVDKVPKPGTKMEYPKGRHTDSTPYGTLKHVLERAGISWAAATGGTFIGLRIGWVNPLGSNRPEDLEPRAPIWSKRMWLSNGDLGRIVEGALTTSLPEGAGLVVNAMSDNEGMVWDIRRTRSALGCQILDGLTADFKDKHKVEEENGN